MEEISTPIDDNKSQTIKCMIDDSSCCDEYFNTMIGLIIDLCLELIRKDKNEGECHTIENTDDDLVIHEVSSL